MAVAISSRGATVIAASYGTFSIALFFVLLRLYVRWSLVRINGREDVIICIALVASLLACVFMHLEVSQGGLGQHFDTLSTDETTLFFKYSYFSIMWYNLSLCLTKFAILFLCLRVFAPSTWYKACIAVLVFLCLHTLWIILVSIMPCLPIQFYWERKGNGWCFPTSVLWFVNAGLNIFSDFVVVLLPIPGIFKLQLPRKQRIGISLVFALGLFVCIISIVRLKALHRATSATDSTFENYDIAIWSVIEVNAAIVGACLPTLKPLISRVWPRLLSSGRSRGHTYTLDEYRDRSRRSKRARPDSLSETVMLGDEGVVLTPFESKDKKGEGKQGAMEVLTSVKEAEGTTGPRVEEVEDTRSSEADVDMWGNSDGWSGRSSQQPVYVATVEDVGTAV